MRMCREVLLLKGSRQTLFDLEQAYRKQSGLQRHVHSIDLHEASRNISTLQEKIPEMSNPGKKTASAPSVVHHVYSILRKEY